jgi:hypothetical protein
VQVSFAEFEVRIMLLTITHMTDHVHLVLQFSKALCVGTGEVPFTLLSSSEAVFPPIISSHHIRWLSSFCPVTLWTDTSLFYYVFSLPSVAYPEILFGGGGGVQQIQLRKQGREKWDLGAVAL